MDLAGKKTDLGPDWATVQGLAWSSGRPGDLVHGGARGNRAEIYGVTPAGKLRLIRTMQGTPALLDVRNRTATRSSRRTTTARALHGVFLPARPPAQDLAWFDWSSDRALSRRTASSCSSTSRAKEAARRAASTCDRPTALRPCAWATGSAVALSPDSAWALTRTSASNPSHFVLVPVRAGQPKAVPTRRPRTAHVRRLRSGRLEVRLRGECRRPRAPVSTFRTSAGGPPRAMRRKGSIPARLFVSPDGRWIAAIGPDARAHLYPLAGGLRPTSRRRSRRLPGGLDGRRQGSLRVADGHSLHGRSPRGRVRAARRTCAISSGADAGRREPSDRFA